MVSFARHNTIASPQFKLDAALTQNHVGNSSSQHKWTLARRVNEKLSTLLIEGVRNAIDFLGWLARSENLG